MPVTGRNGVYLFSGRLLARREVCGHSCHHEIHTANGQPPTFSSGCISCSGGRKRKRTGKKYTALIFLTAVMGDSSVGQAASIAEK